VKQYGAARQLFGGVVLENCPNDGAFRKYWGLRE
jgi:hypothetical protein